MLIQEYCKQNQIPLLIYKYTIPLNHLEEILLNDILNICKKN